MQFANCAAAAAVCSLHFFIKTILKEHEAHFCSKFKNKLRTIPASAK